MCCICPVCDLVKLSFSRMIVYIIQLVLVALGSICLYSPSEWTYVLLFKNSTYIQEYLQMAIPKISIPGFGDVTTVGSTTTLAPLANSHSTIFWCALLIGSNLIGFISVLFDLYMMIFLYAIATGCYLYYGVLRLLATHNYLYSLDVVAFGLLLIHCLCLLFWASCHELCCGKDEQQQKPANGIVPLGEMNYYIETPTKIDDPLLRGLSDQQPYAHSEFRHRQELDPMYDDPLLQNDSRRYGGRAQFFV